MADIYFNSPPRVIAAPRRARTVHPKVSPPKRKRADKMDGFSPHAYMARLDEPTFCPSNLSAILTRYSLPSDGTSGTRNLPVPELIEDDDGDDDDDSAGGVALFSAQEPQDVDMASLESGHDEAIPGDLLMDTLRGVTSSHAPDEAGDTAGSQWRTASLSAHMLRLPIYTAPSVLGTSHPRPQTQELWDEEDSRRLRFALDGFDTSDVPRFVVGHDEDEHHQHAVTSSNSPSAHADSMPSTRMVRLTDSTEGNGREEEDLIQEPRLRTLDQPHDELLRPLRRDSNYAFARMLDDDWLAVDDPKRSYDFADFMDHWRLRSMTDKRVTPFKLGIQPSVRLRRAPEHLARDDLGTADTDMQGIHWRLMGPSRQDAVAARAQLLPSRNCFNNRQYGRNAVLASKHEEESVYRFRSFTPCHRAQTSHYQLRNVMAANSRSDIFYSTGSKVMRASLACPSLQDTVMDLTKAPDSAAGFRITCLATSSGNARSGGLLLAGGFGGEYAMLNLDAKAGASPHVGFVTHAYNGLVTHAHTFSGRRSGLPQAAFCSNDRKLRLMDAASLRFTNEFTYAHAINCAATAPDGRLRAVVGDSCEGYITDAERGTVLVTLKEHHDHGFACAWAGNGIHVAAGAQDGRTLVWDARNWARPLASLPSTMSCPRSLQFTDDDALVVAESDDIVSIYGAGTFKKRQDIRFFGSVAGVVLLDGGTELAVGNTDKTVGGLLTFERTSQGRNKGTFGERLAIRPSRGHDFTSSRYPNALDDVCI